MAHTRKGAELTSQHRTQQMAITATLVDWLRDLFLSIFDPMRMDESSADFIREALPVVLAARDLSTEVATTYLDAFRRVELRGLIDHADLTPDLTDPLSTPRDVLEDMADQGILEQDTVDEFVDSMQGLLDSPATIVEQLHSSTAAVAKKKIKEGKTQQQATQAAEQAMLAKSMRIVSDGGRAPLLNEVRKPSRGPIGYARVVDPDPCPFCAMLASRGAVYRSDAFAESNTLFTGDNDFKVHDGCECTLEPVYGKRATDLPAGSDELAKEWAEVAAGQPNPWAAWRRYKESGTKPGEERSNARYGVNGEQTASAPQYGRQKERDAGKRKGRKQIGELDKAELEQTLKGMYIRRAGLEQHLADLEARGQSVNEPGPAQHIDVQLNRINNQITHAKRRLAKM